MTERDPNDVSLVTDARELEEEEYTPSSLVDGGPSQVQQIREWFGATFESSGTGQKLRRDPQGELDIKFAFNDSGLAWTPWVTPEMRTEAELNNYYETTRSWRAPQYDVDEETLDSIGQTADFIDQFNPGLSAVLRNDPMSVFLLPEVAAAVGTYDDKYSQSIATDLLSAAFERNEALYTSEDLQFLLKDQETVAELFDRVSSSLDEGQNDLLATLLATTPQRYRANVAAQAIAMWEENPTLREGDERWNYLWEIARRVRGEQQRDTSAQSGFGRFGEVMDAPYRAFAQPILEGINPINLWQKHFNPEDYSWRKELTIGQNTMYTLGADPTDGVWEVGSGIIDGFNLVVFDPLNIAAGLGVGVKAAKTIPTADKMVDASRLVRAIKASVPLRGKGTTNLPFGMRNVWTRTAYAFTSKNVDEIVNTAHFTKTAERILKLNKEGKGAARLLEDFPDLQKILATQEGTDLLESISRADNIDDVRTLFYTALTDMGVKPIESTMVGMTTKIDDSLRRTTDLARKLAREGRLSIDDMDALGDGTRLARISRDGGSISFVDDVAKAADKTVVAVPGGTKIVDITVEGDSVADLIGFITRKKGKASAEILDALGTPGVKDAPIDGIEALGDVAAGLPLGTPTPSGFWGDLDDVVQPGINIPLGGGGLPVSGLSDDALDLIREWAGRADFDLVRVAGNDYITTTKGVDSLVALTRGLPTDPELVARMMEHAKILSANLPQNANHRITILQNLPDRSSAVGRKVKSLWRRHAPNNVEGWWGNATRRATAYVFSMSPPSEISTHDVATGYKQLRSMLRHFGVTRDDIGKYLNRYMQTPAALRHDLINEIVSEMAQQIDHPIIYMNLRSWIRGGNKGIPYGYADPQTVGEAGRALGMAASRVGDDVTALPILSNQMSEAVPLFDKAFYDMYRRLRQSRRLNRLGEVGKKIVKGFGPDDQVWTTSGRRKALVAQIRNKYEAAGKAITDDELYAIAYSIIDPGSGVDGLGYLSRLARGFDKGIWSPTKSIFTRNQLAGRALPWMIRVVAIDEHIRAAIYSLPSLYRHPFAYMHDFVSAWSLRGAQVSRRVLAKAVAKSMKQFDGVTDVDEAMRVARSLVHGFDDLLSGSVPSVSTIRKLTSKALSSLDSSSPTYGIGRSYQRAKKLSLAADRTKESLGLWKAFDMYDDGAAILQKGFHGAIADEVSASADLIVRGPQMSKAQKATYGYAWGGQLHQTLTDPLTRKYVIQRFAAESMGAAAPWGVSDLILEPKWAIMRNNIQRMATHSGLGDLDDLSLAKYYLDEQLVPFAKSILRPLYSSEDGWVGVERLLHAGGTFNIGGMSVNLAAPGARKTFVEAARRAFVTVGDNADAANLFPVNIINSMSSNFLESTIKEGAWKPMAAYKRATNWIIENFGEKMSLAINREPAYLRIFKHNYDYLISRGLDVPMAQKMANEEAIRLVNYVYFNTSEMSPLIRKMNHVFPFSGAMWEVNQTWFYKLPFASATGSKGFAAASLVHRTNELLKSLVSSGLVTIDLAMPDAPAGDVLPESGSDGDRFFLQNEGVWGSLYAWEDGEWKRDRGWSAQSPSMSLHLDRNLGSHNAAANFLSKMGWFWPNSGAIVVRHLMGLTNAGKSVDLDDLPDSFTLSLGNPVDPSSTGLTAATQVSLGMVPMVAWAVNTKIRPLPLWAGGSKWTSFSEPITVAEAATRMDREIGEVLFYNEDQIVAAIGRENYNLLRSGADAKNFTLPAGTELKKPRSTAMGSFLDGMLNPFGVTDNFSSAALGYLPSFMRYMFQGLGINTTPVLSALLPPEMTAAISGDLLEGMHHAEATEGLLTKAWEAKAAYSDFIQANSQNLTVEYTEDGVPLVSTQYSELAKEHERLWKAVETTDKILMDEAAYLAMYTNFVRGLSGAIGPSNPKIVSDGVNRRALYYGSRDFALDSVVSGSELRGGNLPEFSSATEMRAFFELASAWYQDPTGDTTKAMLAKLERDHGISIAPYLQGKTFWASGGQPAEWDEYDEYLELLKSGAIEPLPLEVATRLAANQSLAGEREIVIISNFGGDVIDSVPAILYNWSLYKHINYDIDAKYEALDYWDENFDGHAYENFVKRYNREFPTLTGSMRHYVEDRSKDIDTLLAMEPDLDGTSVEWEEFSKDLRGVLKGMRGAAYDYRTYEGKKNPRELAISQYFDEVIGGYFEARADIFDKLATATDSEVRSTLYNRLREMGNQEYFRVVYMDIGGDRVRVPNASEFLLGALERGTEPEDDELRAKMERQLRLPPEWMSADITNTLASLNPNLSGFLPTEREDFLIYDEFADHKVELKEKMESGEISVSEYNKMVSEADDHLRELLHSYGRGREAEFLDMTPAQRFAVAGLLPERLKPLLQEFNAAFDQVRAMGFKPTSTNAEVRRLYQRIRERFYTQMEADPGLENTYHDFVSRVYDNDASDIFFYTFFIGGNIGGL